MANTLLHKAPGRLQRLPTRCSLALVLLFLFMLSLIARGAAALAAGLYFSAHLLIEIQMRYRSTMLLFLLPLTACGADGMTEFCSAWANSTT